MSEEIKRIDLGGVNCYLMINNEAYILVDSGVANRRAALDKALEASGCRMGNLKLIILTHGDVDHIGNCIFLREKYCAKIAIHEKDAGMVEHGDMGWNRKAKPDKIALLFKMLSYLAPLFVNPAGSETFKADLTIDGTNLDLAQYGFDAKILYTPGHSKGSISVVTGNGDLICGDLLYNLFKPECLCIDDMSDFRSSLEKLRKLDIKTIYPGHGKPFLMERFWKNYRGI